MVPSVLQWKKRCQYLMSRKKNCKMRLRRLEVDPIEMNVKLEGAGTEPIATTPVFDSLLQVTSDYCVNGRTKGAIVG